MEQFPLKYARYRWIIVSKIEITLLSNTLMGRYQDKIIKESRIDNLSVET